MQQLRETNPVPQANPSNPSHETTLPLALGAELGRGGFGRVYIKADEPSLCVKISTKHNGQSCRQWSNEYKKIKDIYSHLESHPLYKKLKRATLLIPKNFIETDADCGMIMPRILRPTAIGSPKNTVETITLHPQLGLPTGSMVFKGRGEFLGLAEIQKWVSFKELKTVAYELGTLMGLIHFVAKNDAYDIEVFLGREKHSRTLKFYIADFDLTETYTNLSEPIIERLRWSMDAVPYFPTINSSPELFKLFLEGYKKIAIGANAELGSTWVNKIFEYYG
jgi:hypothetical protein